MASRIIALVTAILTALATAMTALVNNLALFAAGGMLPIAVFGGYAAALLALLAGLVLWWRPTLAHTLLLVALTMSLAVLAAAWPEHARIAAERDRSTILSLLPNVASVALATLTWLATRRLPAPPARTG